MEVFKKNGFLCQKFWLFYLFKNIIKFNCIFKDDILARWKADSNITYIETRQELSHLLKAEEKIDSKF